MELIQGTASLARALRSPVLTIGNFDGIHRGHRAIMEIVVARARALSGEAVVYTFDPHPRKVLQPDHAPNLLTTLDQKLELLDSLGVDVAIIERFDRDFANLSPDDFVRKFIHSRIRPIEVYVGYDFHFGRDREGSMRLLTETGPLLGFSVTIIPEVTVAGRDVNSTRIRDLLKEGEVAAAAELLGRPFAVRGRVVEGDRRGRTIGFPTANIAPDNEILPAAGVYAGHTRVVGGPGNGGDRWPTVTNVGTRPTFKEGGALLAEAHLIGFEGELYDSSIEVTFANRLRSERKFAGVEELRAQIGRDVAEAQQMLGAA